MTTTATISITEVCPASRREAEGLVDSLYSAFSTDRGLLIRSLEAAYANVNRATHKAPRATRRGYSAAGYVLTEVIADLVA